MANRWSGFFLKNVVALVLAVFDRGSPLKAKAAAVAALLYAAMPFDLIVDFVPILGWLDDATLVALCMAFASKQVPEPVWAKSERRASKLFGKALWRWVFIGLASLFVAGLAFAVWLAWGE